MIVTTTPDLEGRSVSGYLGVVAAQGVLGVNAFKDVAAGVCDSLVELEKRAAQLGAHAVIDYESVTSQRWSSYGQQ